MIKIVNKNYVDGIWQIQYQYSDTKGSRSGSYADSGSPETATESDLEKVITDLHK